MYDKFKAAAGFLATTTVVLSVLAAVDHSFLLGAFAGLFLTLTSNCAHNFFHMKDNWRMYLFNMSLFVVRQWRISHSLSHHMFPNTHHDLEISSFEPMMIYFPIREKSKLYGVLSAMCSPLIYPFLFMGAAVLRTLLTWPRAEDLVGLMLPTVMFVVGQVCLWDTLAMWLFIILVGSFFFGIIALNSGHHHPEIFHYGDKPRENRDWGLHTIDATRDKVESYGATNLGLVTYGDHTLHHLFPTVDHVYLHDLYPVLDKTCQEFGINYKMKRTWDLFSGQFRQLMRNVPNLKDPCH